MIPQQKDSRTKIAIIVLASAVCVAATGCRPVRGALTLIKGTGVRATLKCVPVPGRTLGADEVGYDIRTLQRRIAPRGGLVQMRQSGTDTIEMFIPGEKNINRVKTVFLKRGYLEFIHTGNKKLEKGDPVPTEYRKKCSDHYGPFESCLIMNGRNLKRAWPSTDPDGSPTISITLDKAGSDILLKHTRSHISQYLTVSLDGNVLFCPVIKGPIHGGKAIIAGQFTKQEVDDIASLLSSGPLVTLVEVKSICLRKPSLGANILSKTCEN